MTTPGGPIATEYVEIRPTPGSKQEFRRGVEEIVDPAAQHITGRVSKALADGLKTPAGSVAAGAAIGTVIGQGVAAGLQGVMRTVALLPQTGFAELKDYQAGLAQIQAGLRSTGGAAGLNADQLERLASAIQKYSGQTDDSIVRSESFLLTFDKIRDSVGKGNDVFTRTTKASADLAARFGGEASDKAIMLGKALQDPSRGLTALSRAGITFNDSQRQTIVALDASGKSLDAQKIILAEVEKQVGGSARAYGQTLPGEIDRAKRSFEDFSQTVIGTAFAHKRETEALAGVVGGVYLAHKAVLAYRALQTTLLGGTAKQVAANALLARSYDGVAASAGRAAAAEGAAGGAGGIPGALPVGGAGRLTGAGRFLGYAGLGGAIGAGAVALDPHLGRLSSNSYLGSPSHFLNVNDVVIGPDGKVVLGPDGRPVRRGAQSPAPVVDTSYLTDPRLTAAGSALAAARGTFADPTKRTAEAASLAGVFGSPFSAVAPRQGDVAAAREAQRRADAAVTAAQTAVRNARGGSGGASAAQIAAAEASVASRQTAIRRRGGDDTSERLSLEAAEARLAELRGKGGVNTDKLRAAEERLRAARVTAADAAKDTRKAEEGTALSVKAVLDRLGGQLKNAQGLRDDSKVLIRNGISRGLLEELDKLEKDAPGTLDKVAKSMTPALAKQLNSQYTAVQKVQQEFLTAPLRAAVEAAKAEQDRLLNEAAASQAEAYQRALKANLFGGLAGPAPTAGGPSDEHGPGPVVLQVTGFNAQQIRHISAQETARAGRQAALAGEGS